MLNLLNGGIDSVNESRQKGITMTSTTETPAFEIPAAVVPFVDILKGKAENANSLAIQLKEIEQGADARVNAVLNTSEDEEITKWRAWNDKLSAQIKEAQDKQAEALANIKVKAATLVDSVVVNVDDLRNEFLTARKEANVTREAIKVFLGGDEEMLNKVMESAGIMEITNLRHGTSGATRGSDGKRKPRLSSATVDGNDVPSPTFTVLAKMTGVDIDVLKSAAYKAAGTEDLFTKVGETIDFTVTGKDNKSYSLTIVPRTDAGKGKVEEVSTETPAAE